MSVLQRSDLEASPLADLHALASTLNIDGFRRLRRDDLIDAILARQTGGDVDAESDADTEAGIEMGESAEPIADGESAKSEDEPASPRRRSRWRLARAAHESDETQAAGAQQTATEEAGAEAEVEPVEPVEAAAAPIEAEAAPAAAGDRPEPRGRQAAGGRGSEATVEGVIELLANGSGFVRITPGEASDDDVYVSAAQVRRCELVPGDRISGPVRSARRSERFPSLIRVETINGEPADEVVAGTRFDDLQATFPTDLLALGAEDDTLAAIDRLAPIGLGSRVVIAGPSRAGKTELLRRMAIVLAERGGLSLEVTLVGVRPEEVGEWQQSALTTTPPLSFAASAEAQAQTVEQAVERGRRIAARGGDAVVLIDTLDGLHPPAARRALAAARNLTERGSLTIIAIAAKPFGGETTVIALDLARVGTGHIPPLDPLATGTVRPDLLVGPDGAAAIIAARADALSN